jgi:hypothetical protein
MPSIDSKGIWVARRYRYGRFSLRALDGGPEHLLLGHEGLVAAAAFDPLGRWIASSDDQDIRLWPIPQGEPLQEMSYSKLLAKLGSLTNLRAVKDETTGKGYRLDFVDFEGFDSSPRW